VASVYKDKKMDKGLAFPTSISVNNCVGNFSPLPGDTTVVNEGDLVKVDLGCHIDGFIATAAHSFICTDQPDQVVRGRKADVICAAHFASECALRLFKPGKKNYDITETIQKVADIFHCKPVEGVLSHQLKRYVIDGTNVIINRDAPEHKVDEVAFEEYDVYSFDIVMSTGEGKTKEGETKTTVYKRAIEQNYQLKMKASRALFSEINQKFTTFPFSMRAFKDEKRARLGLTECLKHELLEPYPVVYEKPEEFVAQFKFTVVMTPNQTLKLTQHPLPFVSSDHQIQDPALLALLNTGTKRSAKKKKKRGKKKGSETDEAQGGVEAQQAAASEVPPFAEPTNTQ